MGDRRFAVAARRLLLFPSFAKQLAEDSYFAPLLVRLRGVELGEGCTFIGSPSIRIAPGASIKLGARVSLSSRPDSNPLGLPHPTILAAVGASARIEIGDDVGISGASIVARESITIGRGAMIGAGACIWDTDFHPLDAAQRRIHPTDGAKSAPVFVEEEAFIGARAIVLKGVRIGRGAVVGAGAVVSKDVAAYNVVAGNPARVVKVLDEHA